MTAICLLLILASHSELFYGSLIKLLLVCSGDIEINPGLKTKNQILLCHWNLNVLADHNFIKVSLLQALSVTHDYDIICLTETFLDPSISNDDERINIKGYNLLRADHPSNKKRGGVCMYYKEHLPIIKRDDLCTLKECLVTEIRVDKKKFFFSCLYRSPSQTQDEFEEFCNDLNLISSSVNDVNATLSVITDDFNVKSRWWSLDKDNAEGREINSLTSAYGYSQLNNKPTLMTKKSSSCIDLIFSTSPNLIRATGIELSIFETCYLNLIYGIIDFKIPLPPCYLREVWDYKNANVNHIQIAVSSNDWEFLFHGANVNKKLIY